MRNLMSARQTGSVTSARHSGAGCDCVPKCEDKGHVSCSLAIEADCLTPADIERPSKSAGGVAAMGQSRPLGLGGRYSHSMVPGGFEVMS
jgi:hypothetical protein